MPRDIACRNLKMWPKSDRKYHDRFFKLPALRRICDSLQKKGFLDLLDKHKIIKEFLSMFGLQIFRHLFANIFKRQHKAKHS